MQNSVSSKQNEISALVAGFCKNNLDEEYLRLCTDLFNALLEYDQEVFKRGKEEIWAASIVWAIGSVNFLGDKSFEPYSSLSDVCKYFKVSKSTVGQKASKIRDWLDIDFFNEKFQKTQIVDEKQLHIYFYGRTANVLRLENKLSFGKFKVIFFLMNKITELFNIRYPIIQGGMIWCSGWELASAVSNAGGLGLIGSGSMYPGVLRQHIQKCKAATDKPFGVNVPLLYPQTDEHIKIIIEEGVKIVFTSAGNPKKYTSYLKENGITVVHVVANVKFAKKCEEAGVDAIVAEGFEAGGHNGFEETTTMALIPQVRKAVNIPLIAAGGIGSGRAMLAAFALGADGVQIGSRFVASSESSAHPDFKNAVVEAGDSDTKLTLKKLVPVRLIKNDFFNRINNAETAGATREELMEMLGKGRAKLGMFEGDVNEGELEIGQVSGLINEIKPVAEIFAEIVEEYNNGKKDLCNLTL